MVNESGTMTILEWQNGNVSGNFKFQAKADNGETKMLEGNFYTQMGNVKVKVITAWICDQDTVPFPFAWFQIGRKRYQTNFFSQAFIDVPVGKYDVTVFKPKTPAKMKGTLKYAIWRNKVTLGASGVWGDDNMRDLGARDGYWSDELIDFNAADEKKKLMLISSDCPADMKMLNNETGNNFMVVNLTGEATMVHLGTLKKVEIGMRLVSGDMIETVGNSVVGLQRDPFTKTDKTEFIKIFPNSGFQFYFYRNKFAKVVKQINMYGTFSKKTKEGSTVKETETTIVPKTTDDTGLSISDGFTWGEEEGTIYSWTYDSVKSSTIVSVEEGSVSLAPENENLKPIVLTAGQKIEITADKVSSLMKADPVSSNDVGGFSLENMDGQKTGDLKKTDWSRYMPIIGPGILILIIIIYFMVKRKKN
jgi:hypothetical protein